VSAIKTILSMPVDKVFGDIPSLEYTPFGYTISLEDYEKVFGKKPKQMIDLIEGAHDAMKNIWKYDLHKSYIGRYFHEGEPLYPVPRTISESKQLNFFGITDDDIYHIIGKKAVPVAQSSDIKNDAQFITEQDALRIFFKDEKEFPEEYHKAFKDNQGKKKVPDDLVKTVCRVYFANSAKFKELHAGEGLHPIWNPQEYGLVLSDLYSIPSWSSAALTPDTAGIKDFRSFVNSADPYETPPNILAITHARWNEIFSENVMDELKKLPKLVPNKQYYVDMANNVPTKIKTLNDYGNKLVHIGPMIRMPILGVNVEVPFRYIFETAGIYQYGSGEWNSNMGFSSDIKSAFAVDKKRWENVIGEPAPDFDDDTLKKNSMAELAKEAYAIAQSIFDDADYDSTLKIISKKLLSPNNGKELVFLGPGGTGYEQLTTKYGFSYYDLFQYSTSSHEWIVGASGSSANAYYSVTKTIWEGKFGISAPKNPNINQKEESKYPETDEEIKKTRRTIKC